MAFPRRFTALAVVLASLLHCTFAAAQDYPNKPIRLIIPWPTGGATDVCFRLWAPLLAESLGQQIVIDNRAGASSIIGLDIVAKSRPDGYTLGAANIAFGSNPFLMSKLPFDPQKDFLPVSQTALVPMVLFVHPSLGVKSVKELIALAKAKPNSLKYSSAGNGSAGHLVTELFLDVAGVRMLHVPYKGGGPQLVSAVSGETSVGFIPIPTALQQIRSGKLVPLGVSILKRDPTLPDVPTIAEAIGIPDFQVSEWQGVVAPAGTPAPVVNRLYQEIAKILARADVKERLQGAGAVAVGGTPQEMAAYIKNEFARWSKLIKKVGIHLD